MIAIIGKKLGMTTIYDGEKGAQNVTLLECAPNTVDLVRTADRDGYVAKRLTAPKTARRTVRKEFRCDDVADEQGATITVEAFAAGDTVRVSGTTKAKGFQGVVKRHGFTGSPASHGHKGYSRQSGSIGCRFPQSVRKGKRMAGRMGGATLTVRGLTVVLVDAARNLIAVRGAVPGVAGRIVSIVKD